MWSFHVYYRFDQFLDFLHSPTVELENGTLCKFIITSIEMDAFGFSDPNCGHYVATFNLIPIKHQLTLF